MYRVTSLLHLANSADEVARSAVVSRVRRSASGTGARRALIEPTLPGVRNGGDVLVHLHFDDASHWNSARSVVDAALSGSDVQHVDHAEYEPGHSGISDNSASVYRTLLLAVAPGTEAASIRRFEAGLLRMPGFVPSMSSWQLSKVAVARGSGGWTHVWEQEFTDIEALSGPYLAHPIHWGYVDKWFDPESPECIVRERVCHSFCSMDDAIIGRVATGLTA